MTASFARAAVGTVLSRGRGYETLRRTPIADMSAVGPYPIDYSAKTLGDDPTVEAGSTPAAVAQWGLGWWTRAGACRQFREAAETLVNRAAEAENEMRWWYDVPVLKYGLRSRWCSALAQGQATSVLVRAWLATGDRALRDAALAGVRPLLVDSELVVHAVEGPTLEEAPSAQPSFILNGWILGLVGLRDAAVGLDDGASGAAFEAGAAALLARLPLYDLGWWTRYSLYPHPIQDLAKPIYHRFHVIQLEAMHDLTGIADFGDFALRWAGYDVPLNRARALFQKAVYVVGGGRRASRAPAAA